MSVASVPLFRKECTTYARREFYGLRLPIEADCRAPSSVKTNGELRFRKFRYLNRSFLGSASDSNVRAESYEYTSTLEKVPTSMCMETELCSAVQRISRTLASEAMPGQYAEAPPIRNAAHQECRHRECRHQECRHQECRDQECRQQEYH